MVYTPTLVSAIMSLSDSLDREEANKGQEENAISQLYDQG